MAIIPVGKASKSYLATDPAAEAVKAAKERRAKRGYDYYGSPTEQVAVLADEVVAAAAVKLAVQEEFTFERKRLFVGVTDAAYYLQDCVEYGLAELGISAGCVVDSIPVGRHGDLGGSLIDTHIHTFLR